MALSKGIQFLDAMPQKMLPTAVFVSLEWLLATISALPSCAFSMFNLFPQVWESCVVVRSFPWKHARAVP